MTAGENFQKIYFETQSVYQRCAKQFDQDRSREGRENEWLETFARSLPPAGHILDLGCGSGEPIAAWLLANGFQVTGVDYAESMLAIARKRFPGSAWVLNDMRDLTITGPFDGVISWHGSFHLTQDEQRALLPKLSKLLKPSASLMLTTGPVAGEVTGTVAGETVYHASLNPGEYKSLLETEGFCDIQHNCEHQTDGPFVLFARR